MSERYPGGLITKTPPTPEGPVETGAAPGVWTLEQQAYWIKQGVWPTAGVQANYIEDVFSTWLYTGSGGSNPINNGLDLAGKGGLVWAKARDNSGGTTVYGAGSNVLFDTSRGINSALSTNTTSAVDTQAGHMSSFNSNGFTLAGNWEPNEFGFNYVSWTFREQAKFYSQQLVTHTNGTATNVALTSLGTIGYVHAKTTGTTGAWIAWHRSLTAGNNLRLNTTAAQTTTDAWLSVSGTTAIISASAPSGTYILHAFAHNAGGFGLSGTDNVVSCGSFDDSAPWTVNLGWEPQWVLYKKYDGIGGWRISDNMRGFPAAGGAAAATLSPNASDVEGSANFIKPTATGMTGSSSAGGNYIYIAIRRGPMRVPTDPTKVFSPNISSGAAGTTITTDFPVDMQIGQYRAGASANAVVDRLRGVSTTSTEVGSALSTSSTTAEGTASGADSRAWGNTGFQMPSNLGGISDVFWNFRRAPGFFDEVCYTATNSGAFRNHNLQAVPELIIDKRRDATGTNDVWYTWHTSFGLTKNLQLNSTSSTTTSPVFITGGSDLPTTTTFFTESQVASTRVAYLFATCPGVSKVGSYTGTGALQTIACGFAAGARFVLIKRTDSTGDWYVWDSARGITSGNDPYLLLNSTAAEVTGTNYVDTTAVGFQVTAAAPAGINANGGTFIFLAIA